MSPAAPPRSAAPVAAELDLGRHLTPGHSDPWTPEELALLERHGDRAVARLTGRTVEAVRVKRGNTLTSPENLQPPTPALGDRVHALSRAGISAIPV